MTKYTVEPTPSGGTSYQTEKTDNYNGGTQKTDNHFDSSGSHTGGVTEHGVGTGETPSIPGTGNYVVNDRTDGQEEPIVWDGGSNPANND